MSTSNARESDIFSSVLFEKMQGVNPGIAEMALYEFRYALHNMIPEKGGWASVALDSTQEIEKRVNSREFYTGIKIKLQAGDRIILDENIARLTQMLFVGLVSGAYSVDWVRTYFYFDIRGFFFLHRNTYFTDNVLTYLGGKPFKQFEPQQKKFERAQDIGYNDFQAANAEVDKCFIDCVKNLIAVKGTPVLMAIAGPTAAGKTEIVERLRGVFGEKGARVSSIELDNFFTDREYREARGIDSLGKQAYHFEIFKQSLEDIRRGKKIFIPQYDMIDATSSHDLNGKLKPGRAPLEINSADVIFIEGNFPFLLQEIAPLIDIKVVYLADDDVRLKRKWKRDIDYRKKYEPTYFRNRYFKDQFLMAEKCYRPQMQTCDLIVDTTGAAIWTTPAIANILNQV